MAVRDVDIRIRAHDRATKNFRKVAMAGKRMGRAFQKLRLLALGAGAAVGFLAFRMGKAAIKEIAAFQKQMAFVSTMLQGNATKQMEAFTKSIDKFSVAFGDSTESLSKGLFDILSAQIEASKATDVLRVAARAAVAGATETSVAVSALVRILNSYKIAAEDAAGVSDLLFQTVEKGLITYEELASGIGGVSAIARSAGVRLHELLAAIATVTRNGLLGDKAMTNLGTALLKLQSATPQATRIAKRFGIELGSLAIQSKGLFGFLKQFERLPTDLLSKILPKKAVVPIRLLLANMEGLQEDLGDMENAAGSTEEAFNKMAKSAGFQLQQLDQAWKSVLRTVGVAILPAFQSVSQWFMDNREEVAAWVSDFFGLLAQMGRSFQAVVLSITGTIDSVFNAFGLEVEETTDEVASKFAWLEGFITKVSKAVVTAFAAIEFGIRNFGDIVKFVVELIKVKFVEFLRWLPGAVGQGFNDMFDSLKDGMSTWHKQIAIVFGQIGNVIGNITQKVGVALANLFDPKNREREFKRLDEEFAAIREALEDEFAEITKIEIKTSVKGLSKAENNLKKMADSLGEKWNKLIKERLKPFEIPPPIAPEIEVEDPEEAKARIKRIIALDLPDIKLDPTVTNAIAAVQQRLGAFQSRFLRERPGRSQDPATRMLRHNAKMLEEQRKIAGDASRTATATESTADLLRRLETIGVANLN